MSIYKSELDISRPTHLGSGPWWRLKDLNEVTIIFGRNGSGKSQLLRMTRSQNHNYHYVSPERGGEINHEPGLAGTQFEAAQRTNHRTTNYQPSYHQEVMSRIGVYLQKRGNTRGDVLKMNPSEIEGFMKELLPNFTFQITTESIPFKIERVFPISQPITQVQNLSSGETQILTFALDLLTICAIWEIEELDERIILIDEPDTHLHPELQQYLASFLLKLTERFKCQLIIATHSTTLLSALGFYGEEKTSVIYLNNSQEEQKAIKFNETLQILSSCLGGHVLMGPLFGFPLLLVEGKDDYVIWSEAVRQHKLKLAIIPCNGPDIQKYRKSLEALLSSIVDKRPSAYCLKDRDDSGSITQDQSALAVPLIKLGCRESENLYICEEVLTSMDKTWEQVKELIIERMQTHNEEISEWQELLTKNPKVANIEKGLMGRLVELVDEKKIDWRLRVGKAVGNKKPEGQLADFLGPEVMNAFWD